MLYGILILVPLLGIPTVQLRLMILKILFHQWKTASGPDCIPIEFYKALFCNKELLETHSATGKCLKLIFNKIWNGFFPKKWNSASIVSIPKKGDLLDFSKYRGFSLINIGLKIVSKIITNRMSSYALTHNFIRPEQFGFSQSWRMH